MDKNLRRVCLCLSVCVCWQFYFCPERKSNLRSSITGIRSMQTGRSWAEKLYTNPNPASSGRAALSTLASCFFLLHAEYLDN